MTTITVISGIAVTFSAFMVMTLISNLALTPSLLGSVLPISFVLAFFGMRAIITHTASNSLQTKMTNSQF
jgi:hypothetical protein